MTARAVHAGLAAAQPGRRLVRVALRAPEGRRWDAAAVGRLLPLLGPAPLGVRAEPEGGLWPAHTLLGAAVALPAGGERPVERSEGGCPPPARCASPPEDT